MRRGLVCPWCGDVPADDTPLVQGYCRPCHAERIRRIRARARTARLSRWYAELGGTRESERAAGLASEIVRELGGYEKAAAELVRHYRQLVADGKAPRTAMLATLGLMRMLERGSPAEEE